MSCAVHVIHATIRGVKAMHVLAYLTPFELLFNLQYRVQIASRQLLSLLIMITLLSLDVHIELQLHTNQSPLHLFAPYTQALT